LLSKKPPVAKPVDPIQQYLTSDTTYQQQQVAINKAIADYRAQNTSAQNMYQGNYALQQANQQRQQQLSGIDQQNDYASRGMVRSGLYAQADSNRLNDYAQQTATSAMGRQNYLTGLNTDLSNFMSSQQLAAQQARQDALQRRSLNLIANGPTAVR
jgi:hypothetical protein